MRLFLVDACIRVASADKAEAILSSDVMQDRRLVHWIHAMGTSAVFGAFEESPRAHPIKILIRPGKFGVTRAFSSGRIDFSNAPNRLPVP